MITGLFGGFLLWLLLAGTMGSPLRLGLSILFGIFLWYFGRHDHTGTLSIDVLAHKSGFAEESPAVKMGLSIVLLVLCLLIHTPWPGLALFLYDSLLIVTAGKISLHDYGSVLKAPLLFLLIGGVALLLDYYPAATGLVSIPFFSGYLCMTQAMRTSAALVMARSFGAVSCLYLLSLSTPMSDHINVLRRIRIPAVVTDLAVLIYRYIFLLLETYHDRKASAAGRLGYAGYRTGIRTTGQIYAGLLGESYRKADICWKAMEARQYDEEIRFLTAESKTRPMTVLWFSLPIAALAVCLGIGL